MVHESLDISKVHNILDKEEAIEAVWGRLGVDQALEGSAAALVSVCVCVGVFLFVCVCVCVYFCLYVYHCVCEVMRRWVCMEYIKFWVQDPAPRSPGARSFSICQSHPHYYTHLIAW